MLILNLDLKLPAPVRYRVCKKVSSRVKHCIQGQAANAVLHTSCLHSHCGLPSRVRLMGCTSVWPSSSCALLQQLRPPLANMHRACAGRM